MEKTANRRISFRVFGERALFSDPVTRIGGEKSTYLIPTYQAIKGIAESIYWKPTFIWKIEKIRVVNPIRLETSGIRPIKYNDAGSNELAYYTYLKDVCYEVVAEFVWNENREDLAGDRNYNKHSEIANRSLIKGGRRDIFLGTRECQGYVEPCNFGEFPGAYDDVDGSGSRSNFGFMFHSFIYPDEAFDGSSYGKLSAAFWYPVMENGVIKFPQAKELEFRREIYKMNPKRFVVGKNFEVSGGSE